MSDLSKKDKAVLTTIFQHFSSIFTPELIHELLKYSGYSIPVKQIEDFLLNLHFVYPLQNDHFISLSGVFQNYDFTIKPTKEEVDLNILIAGHRCFPFLGFQYNPHYIEFLHKKKSIPKKIETLNTDFLYRLYDFFNNDYFAQLIFNDIHGDKDPVNVFDFKIPRQTNHTVFDMKELYKKWNFKYGDRILCHIEDWGNLLISIIPSKESHSEYFVSQENNQQKKEWYNNLDTAFLDIFETYGTTNSLYEQALLTFQKHKQNLSTKNAASLEEFISHSKKVSIRLYGAEQRFWYPDQDFTIPELWEQHIFYVFGEYFGRFAIDGTPFTKNVLIAQIYDMHFNGEKDISIFEQKILPKEVQTCGILTPVFYEQYDQIEKTYNKFYDFELAPARRRALSLYANMVQLIYTIEKSKLGIKKLPFDTMATLSQLFSFLTWVIDSIVEEQEDTKNKISIMNTSLDGMEFHFNMLYDELSAFIKKHKNEHTGFALIPPK